MSNEVYAVVIAFKNGLKKHISQASSYKLNSENRYVTVVKNGYQHFFNFDEILYVGREFDLEDGEND